MPTVGWILEDAVERFWEGRHTTPDRPESPPPVFACKYCGQKLASREDLRRHYNLLHPLELPVLHVRGEPLLRQNVVRRPLRPDDIELIQCTRCEIQADGGPWVAYTPEKFVAKFATPNNSTWNVRLLHERAVDNSRAAEEYQVRFRIPNPVVLNAVDEHFIRTLALDELTHSDLHRFEATLPVDTPSREYAAALGDYALGILLKERRVVPRSELGFEEFAVKMRAALETLQLFDRPVALSVARSIRFNLNDFSHEERFGVSQLERALHFFHCLKVGKPIGSSELKANRQEVLTRAVCPIDATCYELLQACDLLLKGTLSLDRLERLRQLTRGSIPISEQDLAKLHIICADGYLRRSRPTDAVVHLRSIQFDPSFQRWARHQLRSVEGGT